MKSFSKLLFSMILVSSAFSACSQPTPLPLPELPESNKVSKLSVQDIPEFNKRKLEAFNAPVQNSVGEQKRKQQKLHTFYFKSYVQGKDSYAVSDTNEHMKMLNKGATATNQKIDANADGKVTLDEVVKFVTTDAYVKYFRDTYIAFSFNKLDTAVDKKLSVDEFNKFNTVIKASEMADFQLLEEFSEYDYNSSRALEIEEYEDFFMKYLLLKVGAYKES